MCRSTAYMGLVVVALTSLLSGSSCTEDNPGAANDDGGTKDSAVAPTPDRGGRDGGFAPQGIPAN